MAGWIGSAVRALAARHRRWRRERNLRTGAQALQGRPAPRGPRWIGAAGVLLCACGAAVIAGHARHLGAQGGSALDEQAIGGMAAQVDALQPAAPGAAFEVGPGPGLAVTRHAGAAVVVAAGMGAAEPVRIDLCSQMLEGSRPRLLPLRMGYRFADVARLVAKNDAAARPLTLRNVALAGPDAPVMPLINISGKALPDFNQALDIGWTAPDSKVQWISDAGAGKFRRDGWLAWPGAALRIHRRPSEACKEAGELVVQLYRQHDGVAERALVTAFPAHGQAVSAWLRPGKYTVPAMPRASLEDEALFLDLEKHGLVRLNAGGLIEVAPRDLAAWQSAPDGARAGELDGWPAVARDAATMTLFKRLYRMADGGYVREQVRIFNSERRLLAWRTRPGQGQAAWQASVAQAPVATAGELPLAAARLFAEVAQGWTPWTRVAAWPESGTGAPARIAMALPQAARGGERIELLLAGRLLRVEGAQLAAQRDACTGRDCPAPGAAQVLVLEMLPGARSVALDAVALPMEALARGDDRYRHLRVADGKLAWRALAINSAMARSAAPAGVTLVDRNGKALWSGGAPSPAAADAGLATLLGLRAGHANSVSGMLSRIASPGGEPHSARMTIDLALQKASHDALECLGMRRGRWDGARCSGGQAAPPGRQAGIVVIDTENGDVLAAAGAGTAAVDPANWNEVRDFDRANPARSPLRLPALQHDGGAHRSPGSTFKIVSALGLELAAQRDPQVEALLAGLPLPAINRMARDKGFAFQTDAASYPAGTRLAHITNYRDQHLDRRAQDGRLGLAQALTYSLNTWFAWSGELSDRSLFGRAEGGVPDLRELDAGALDPVRPIAAMAHRLGFERELRLDGGLLPAGFRWSQWDALQASEARIDPIHTRHELRQMAIGLRMQVTPLHMAMVAGAVGQGRAIAPRLLLELDGREAGAPSTPKLGVRLDRIRDGMKGVVDSGTAAGAFRAPGMAALRRGLSGKTGTAPSIVAGADGTRRELATVWFTGWLEPGSVPGQRHRLAVAAFVSHSEGTGGEHAAPVVAAVLAAIAAPKPARKGG